MYVETYVEFDVPIGANLETFRFTFANAETRFGAIPALRSLSVTPAVVDPGVSIGVRASVRVSIKDFHYPLDGTAFESGTFFGKLRARRHSLQGLPFRLIRGEAGQALEDMVTEHYVIESSSRSGDTVSLVAKDLLKLADGDRAQAPAVSTGRVAVAIDDVETSLVLTPAGIGDFEYPESGKVNIGGSEICAFTRSGDTLTLTRGESGTTAQEHEADETVQLVLEYVGESPADIFYDILTTYTDVDPDWCPLTEWKDDIDLYIGRLYSAEIAEPTAVKKLLDELIEQVGLVTWWDAIERKIRLKSLRPVPAARAIGTDEMMADSFKFTEQPNKHAHAIWTYFALRNPLEKLDDTQNYRSSVVTVDPEYDPEIDGPLQIRKVFSRWIALNNRPAASRLNEMLLARYKDPPRKFSFDLFRTNDPVALGQGLELRHWTLQDVDGRETTVPVMVTSVEPAEDRYVIDAEEMIFSEVPTEDPGARVVIIDSSVFNVNLRTLHDLFYSEPEEGDEILCIVESGAVVGSTSVSVPAFTVGDWPSGVDITLRVNGRIQGRGGDGGQGGYQSSVEPIFVPPVSGDPGGTALYTRYEIKLQNNGQIWGGGGGGGGGLDLFDAIGPGGGGGAGTQPGYGGIGGPSGSPGTAHSGGNSGGGLAGAGGNPGQAGGSGSVAGGDPGAAVDGASYVTYDVVGSIAGPQIN